MTSPKSRKNADSTGPDSTGPSRSSPPEGSAHARSADSAGGELARDRALVDAWRRGDADAGESLLGHYHGYFRSLCWRYRVIEESEQEEHFQELVVRLLRALPRLELESSFAGYLRRVYHTVWRETRSRGTTFSLVEDPEGRKPALPAPERNEILGAIVECSEALTERESEVFRGRIEELEEFSEIAERLEVTLNHLYVIYHGARRKMRECLKRKGFSV